MRKSAILVLAALFTGAAAHAAGNAVTARTTAPEKAWYDFLFSSEEPAAQPQDQTQQNGYSEPARLVPISGHFDVTAENIMALKVATGAADRLSSSLSAMGFGVTMHDDFHGGYFLMVNVGATDPVEAALTFLEYKDLSEVWVKRSLYEAVMTVR